MLRKLLFIASAVLLVSCKKQATSPTTAPSGATQQSNSGFTDMVAVLPVRDFAAASAWYARWIGRKPDLVPMEGIAEWKLVGNGWIQVALDPESTGGASVVLGVKDIEQQHAACVQAQVAPGEIQDHGFIKLFEVQDPAGNKVLFLQEVAQQNGASAAPK